MLSSSLAISHAFFSPFDVLQALGNTLMIYAGLCCGLSFLVGVGHAIWSERKGEDRARDT